MRAEEEQSRPGDDSTPAVCPDVGFPRGVALLALAAGAWAMLPPYLGPSLAVEMRMEIVDHVVPGAVVLALASAAVGLARQAPRRTTLRLAAGLGVVLAGIWLVSTHVPLVAQATRGEVEWLPVAHHSLPGLAVVGVGVLWAAACWKELPS